MFVTECFHNKCLNCQPCVQFIFSPRCGSDMILSVMTLSWITKCTDGLHNRLQKTTCMKPPLSISITYLPFNGQEILILVYRYPFMSCQLIPSLSKALKSNQTLPQFPNKINPVFKVSTLMKASQKVVYTLLLGNYKFCILIDITLGLVNYISMDIISTFPFRFRRC